MIYLNVASFAKLRRTTFSGVSKICGGEAVVNSKIYGGKAVANSSYSFRFASGILHNLLRPTDSANSLKSYGFASGFPRKFYCIFEILILLNPKYDDNRYSIRAKMVPLLDGAVRPLYMYCIIHIFS